MTVAAPQEFVIKAPEFRGGNLALGSCRDLEVCLDGPAGTGKTYAALYKIHLLLTLYPGARALVARKTNTALSGSAMVTFREDILRPEENVKYFGGNRIRPAAFMYPNGSELVINGLDKAEKVKSTAFDIALINEATEVTLEDWEFVRSRLRHGKLPYHQLIADVNPVEPTHWLNQRMIEGLTTRLLSRHEENPRYFSNVTQDWTEEGRKYIFEVLSGLTGVRLARLRYGIWSAASGTVYEDSFDRARNVIDRFAIPREYPRWLSVDFGYVHPFVCLWCAEDPDGRLIVYRQVYKTKTLVEDHAVTIALASGWYHLLPKTHPRYDTRPGDNADPLPREIICDHDAEDRATLERHLGLYTTPARKTVSDGIQAVASRFRAAGDGKPRLVIHRDCVVERDQELFRVKKPTCLEDEPEGYIWDVRQGMKKGEQPVKENDDGCLVAGTMIRTRNGDVPIEQIAIGEYVLTRNGYKRVVAAGMTQESAEVYTVTFSNGATLTGTGNHPVYLSGQKYIPLRSLRYGDIIEDIKQYSDQYTERYPLCQSLQQNEWKPSSTKGLRSGVIQSLLIGRIVTTTDQALCTSWQALRHCIRKSGKMLTALFQKGVTSITKMRTLLTTPWITWNVSHKRNMQPITPLTCQMNDWSRQDRTWKTYDLLPLRGTSQKWVGRGIKSLVLRHGKMQSTETMPVSSVEKSFNQGKSRKITHASAPITVNRRGVVTQGLITRRGTVSSVEKSLSAITMLRSSTVPGSVAHNGFTEQKSGIVSTVASHSRYSPRKQSVSAQPHVLTITSGSVKQPVYNLTVENTVGEGEYFANGILVHNCDALRYMVAHRDLRPSGVSYFPDIWT